MSNTSGNAVLVSTDDLWRAFDSLPRPLRQALANANENWNPIWFYEFYQEQGIANTLKFLETLK